MALSNSDDIKLRLWTVEVETDRRGGSPARPRYFSRRHVVNVAAPDIVSAIKGAIEELEERYIGEDPSFDPKLAWVVSANHKGAVNRIVELQWRKG
jgi:hypothetical protein